MSAASSVERHKTAIRRDDLSRPLSALGRHGYLKGQYTVFDYGCGHGDDVRRLKANGVQASGWDPYYAPNTPKSEADIVNVGYVVNVINDAAERAAVVQDAWRLCRTCLVVGVMLRGQGGINSRADVAERISQRNTYQKYFSQAELRDWVTETLGEPALPVGPGIVVVHRDKLAEQRFLLERHRRPVGDVLFSPRAAKASAEQIQDFYEAHRATLDQLWTESVRRGRTPVRQELTPELAEAVEGLFRSLERGGEWLASYFGPDDLHAGAARRREDLLVTFALDAFAGRRRYREWPEDLQQDVRALWSSYKAAVQEAHELLFSLGQSDTIAVACREGAESGLGHLEDSKSFQLHCSQIPALPPALRTYIGCAEQLYGDIEGADLVKIHIRSGKLTLLFYDDFNNRTPMLQRRVKILLREQDIYFFEYGEEYPEQPLWLKSLYMTREMAGYQDQKRFDDCIVEKTGLDFSGFGPSWSEFEERAASIGVPLDR